jgi:hypothetical protein
MTMTNEYRNEARQAIRNARWIFLRVLPLLLLVFVVGTATYYALQATGIIGADIEREVVRHSRQFIEGKQAQLQALYTEYASLQARADRAKALGQKQVEATYRAQQLALMAQMRREAKNISMRHVPREVRLLIYRR